MECGLDRTYVGGVERGERNVALQPTLDGIRVLFHVNEDGVRITGRNFKEVSFRLTEQQACVAHLNRDLRSIAGTILDGELLCPIDHVDTGETITTSKLQAAVAVLAAAPKKAQNILDSNKAHLQFHCFDILKSSGIDVTDRPLLERLDLKQQAVDCIDSEYVKVIPSYFVNKKLVHDRLIADGGEGTVWKRLDQPYEIGKRVKHWMKRKRSYEVKAFVSNFKLGSIGHGNENLIGAVEFSINENNATRPIAWICNLTNHERRKMTSTSDGKASLVASYLGREAIVVGQAEDLGPRTSNHYAQAFEQFCLWLFRTKRLAVNPVMGLHRLNSALDVRRQRRALTIDEFGKLVASAEASSEEIQCMSGVERARLYKLSWEAI